MLEEYDFDQGEGGLRVDGKIPDDLRGAFMRNRHAGVNHRNVVASDARCLSEDPQGIAFARYGFLATVRATDWRGLKSTMESLAPKRPGAASLMG